MKHPCHIEGFNGSLEEAVSAVGKMRYDCTAEFLGKLADDIKRQADADKVRGRPQLANLLYETAEQIYFARDKMQKTSELCKQHMEES